MQTTKAAKLPPLGPQTRLLSFDLEANGLHGPVFAVGAVVVGTDGTVHDKFAARCPLTGPADTWVAENVLPVLGSLPLTHNNSNELRNAFWQWYLPAEAAADYVLVSNGYPVEYRFLIQCQEDDLPARYWQHPFPILDLATIFLATGYDAAAKTKLLNDIFQAGQMSRHHPVDDALVAALAAFRALRLDN